MIFFSSRYGFIRGIQFHEFFTLFLKASMLIYDCGIMGNDQELASALWRRFFLMNQPDGPRIELLVKYVRHCMNMLDDIPNEHYYIGRRIDWPSLDEINALK